MNAKNGLITVAGGICFMVGVLATTTVAADEVNSKDKAAAVAEVSLVAKSPGAAQARQHGKAVLSAGASARPTLADIWDKNKCFVVLSGHCL